MKNLKSQSIIYSCITAKGRIKDEWFKTNSRWIKINMKERRSEGPDEGWVFWGEAVKREASVRRVRRGASGWC